ncbi:MAG: hypothetical protein ACM3H9_06050 [Rhodospirillaceae bacterium]
MPRSACVHGFALALLTTLTGCLGPDSVAPPTGNAGPTGPGAVPGPGSTAAQVAAQVRYAPVAVELIDKVVQIWQAVRECPATFDLGNGVSGTCDNSYGDYFWVVVSGSDGGPLSIDLKLYFYPGQPDGSWLVGDDGWGVSNVAWPGGSSPLYLRGYLFTDGSGNFTGFNFETVGVNQGGWGAVPGELRQELLNGFRTRIDLHSGTGTLSTADALVASLSLRGGCTTVDFVDPEMDDLSDCLW